MSKRKKWITPQLVVLVRGKPEEGVLAACKMATPGEVGAPLGYNGACLAKAACTSFGCDALVAS